MNLNQFDEPFSADDIEWRVQRCGIANDGRPWAMVLAYVTNRAIMKRLDDVCGKAGWRNQFETGPDGGVLCGISVRVDNEWITKWDGAEKTQVEAVKGGISGAMKRAAVQWGIGRYLYDLEENFAECSIEREQGWNKAGFKDKKTNQFASLWWKPPVLPEWALPREKPVDADAILAEFTNLAGSEINVDKLKAIYADAWAKLDGFEEHQAKAKRVTGIRLKEIEEPKEAA